MTPVDTGVKFLQAFSHIRLVRDDEFGVDIQGYRERDLAWSVIWTFPER